MSPHLSTHLQFAVALLAMTHQRMELVDSMSIAFPLPSYQWTQLMLFHHSHAFARQACFLIPCWLSSCSGSNLVNLDGCFALFPLHMCPTFVAPWVTLQMWNSCPCRLCEPYLVNHPSFATLRHVSFLLHHWNLHPCLLGIQILYKFENLKRTSQLRQWGTTLSLPTWWVS